MKHLIKKAAAILLVLACLIPSALAANVQITGKANLRTGPGLSYGTITSVSSGSLLEYWNETRYDNRGVAWYNVIYGNRSAWVSSRYAVIVGSPCYCPSYTYVYTSDTLLTTGKVNVRTGPGMGYRSLGTLKKGRTATFLGQSSVDSRGVTWYQILYGGTSGWVSSRYVSFY